MSVWHPGAEPIGVLPREALLGRDAAAVALEEACGRSRVVTVLGAGGAGKTALAAAVTPAVAGALGLTAWWVDLQPVDDPDGVGPALAAGLDVPVAADGRAAATQLARTLGDRELLLVLDNCEQVVEAVAEALEVVVSICPNVRVLATSREVIGVAREEVLRLRPLDVPPDAAVPSVEELQEQPATALFLQRARLDPATLDDDERAAAAAVCRAVDGLPLAIELAAARSPLLSVAQIEDALADRFRLLSTRRRTVTDRQQTLEASIGWSYDLLDDDERRLLRAVAVFPAAFDLAGAATVGADGDEVLALDLLAGLVDKSLVAVQPRPSGRRYRLYESVRAFGERELARNDEADQVRDRHVDATLARLRGMVADEQHEGQVLRSDPWITDELDDVRAASRRAVATDRPSAAVDLWWAVHTWGSITHTATQAPDVMTTVDPAELDGTRLARRQVLLLRGSPPSLGTGADPDAVPPASLDHLPLTRLQLHAWAAYERCYQAPLDRELIDRDIGFVLETVRRHDVPDLVHVDALSAATIALTAVGRNREAHVFASEGIALAERLELPVQSVALRHFGVGAASAIHHAATGHEIRELVSAIPLAPVHERPFRLQPFLTTARTTGDLSPVSSVLEPGAIPVGAVGSEGWLVLQWLRALWLLHRDDPAAAARVTGEAIRHDRNSFWLLTSGLLAAHAVALARCGRVEEARDTAQRAEAELGPALWGLTGAVHEAWCEVHAAAGESEAQLSQAVGAVAHALEKVELTFVPSLLLHAAEALAALDHPDEAARTLGVVDGDLARRDVPLLPDLAALRDRVEVGARNAIGDDAFEQAAATGHDLSWAEWLEWVQRGQGEREAQRPATGWAALTDAEVEVARRAAEGLTNAELAETLFVSVNTVKTHLRHVYTKLDVSSRLELADAVREHT